jgi:hypothetical protein
MPQLASQKKASALPSVDWMERGAHARQAQSGVRGAGAAGGARAGRARARVCAAAGSCEYTFPEPSLNLPGGCEYTLGGGAAAGAGLLPKRRARIWARSPPLPPRFPPPALLSTDLGAARGAAVCV